MLFLLLSCFFFFGETPPNGSPGLSSLGIFFSFRKTLIQSPPFAALKRGGGEELCGKKCNVFFFWTHKVMEFLFLRMIFVPFFIGWFLGESAVCWYKGLDFMGLITIFHHHLRDMFFFKYFFQPPFPSKSKLAFLQKSIWKSQNVVKDMTLNLEASIGKNQTKSLIMVGAPWDGGHAR